MDVFLVKPELYVAVNSVIDGFMLFFAEYLEPKAFPYSPSMPPEAYDELRQLLIAHVLTSLAKKHKRYSSHYKGRDINTALLKSVRLIVDKDLGMLTKEIYRRLGSEISNRYKTFRRKIERKELDKFTTIDIRLTAAQQRDPYYVPISTDYLDWKTFSADDLRNDQFLFELEVKEWLICASDSAAFLFRDFRSGRPVEAKARKDRDKVQLHLTRRFITASIKQRSMPERLNFIRANIGGAISAAKVKPTFNLPKETSIENWLQPKEMMEFTEKFARHLSDDVLKIIKF